MNSFTVAFIALVVFTLGYRFYSSRIARLWDIDPDRETPAVTKYDGVDYVPAKHWLVLFGHHFASIAGAAPVIGPVIAVAIWGWGPALIWVVLGTIFMGGVHDFGALMISVRQEGRSIPHIAREAISRRAAIVFSIFVWLTLLLVIAVFVFFCAQTLASEPRIVIPSLGLIPLAVFMGFMLHHWKLNQVIATVIGLALLALLLVLGSSFGVYLGDNSLKIWSIVLLVYAFIASITPVHILLQPRDYLSAFLLAAGMILGYAGIVISRAPMQIPFYAGWGKSGEALWPMLFVTVACGAISGFHSLIAGGTTSKQLHDERYARRIGYGAMVMEGVVAVLALLAVAAGLANQETLRSLLAKGGPGPVGAFGQGFGTITKPLLGGFGGFVAITILNAFILTTLDTATRIGRYLTHELFHIKGRIPSSLIVIFLGGWLGLSGKWNKIWPIFGAANQLVAALTLIVITSWLLSRNKYIRYTLIPAVIMLATTVGALVYQIIRYLKTGDFLLTVIAASLLGLALFILWETRSIRRGRKMKHA